VSELFHRQRPPAEVVIRSAQVLDPREEIAEPLDLLIRRGEIAELGAPGTIDAPESAEIFDATGKHLFPGFVDPHVHLRTPGQEHKEDLNTGTAAAAAGGFVSVLAMPNTDPPVDEVSVLRSLIDVAEREAHVPVGFLASITRGLEGEELTEMAELRDAGALGFTDDGKPVSSAGMLRKALQYQRLCGGILALHEEDPALSGDGVMHEGAVSARLGLAGIPSVSESTMVARDAGLAIYEAGRVHFQHLSCAESVQAIREVKAAGARVTAEVTPHHLALTHDAVRTIDSRFKMNPPLRSEEDREALLVALKDGTIDCIATDHAPHAPHEKEVPFEQAAMGTTGLESAFPALYTDLVLAGELDLPVLVERLTAGAALYGLPTPRIRAGEPGNLCVIDLEAQFELGGAGYVSRSKNCCFHGRSFHGKVLLTLAGGVVAFRERLLAPVRVPA
jgi:dihydroorotase